MKTKAPVRQPHPECKPYSPRGAALTAWKSRRREVLLAGPAGTGKSRACLEKLHFCADKYKGMRGLICRKSRHSLTQTAMVTFEKHVLPDGWLESLIHFNVTDQQYEYPNGSVIVVGGLDKASKIMSSEYDMIYIQEATELLEDDLEALTTRLRNNVMPYQQLLADCNPGPPNHWLKQRCDRGATLMVESRHEDNPSVTAEYIATLDALTGVRYLRLRKGIWAAAEGLVYEEWDPALHLVSLDRLIEWQILEKDESLGVGAKQVLASVDWGWTNPGVIQVWAIDGDGRIYLIHEVYQTGQTIDWWIGKAHDLQQKYGIERFICDPAEPAFIQQFNAAGISALGAINDIAPGISVMQERMIRADDGRPRLYVYEYALEEQDARRVEMHQPCCFEGEINEYVWPKQKDGAAIKEVPVKVNDHAVDAARYLCMYLREPIITPSQHLADLQRRIELQKQRTPVPAGRSWR